MEPQRALYQCLDERNTAAATAMALLAFQGHGDTHRDGKYAKVVAHGWSAC